MGDLKLKEIDVIADYHNEILKAWKMVEKEPAFKELYKRDAFAQDKLYKNGIVFLGVGASFDIKKSETCEIKGNVQYETYKGRIGYDYYQPMIKISEETGFNWSNIDITLFRETRQKDLLPFFMDFPAIMQKQLMLAKDMIIDARPKIIIVSNAFVRKVLRKEIKEIQISDFEINETTDTIKKYITPTVSFNNELKNIPIFFTSMLSGQGRLDNGSFDRLIWHINFIKQFLKD